MMTTLNIRNEHNTDGFITSELIAAAASQTIDLKGFKRAVVYVKNADDAADAYVTVKAGDGIRSSLGDMIAIVEYGNEGVIKITDTMRYASGDKLTVELNDASGDPLAAGVLSGITIFAMVE